MQNQSFEIARYKDEYRNQLLDVWEKSVAVTHNFLSQADFPSIKQIVQKIDFNSLDVFCMVKDDIVAGFIGVADSKVEMLFLDPAYFGQGLGNRLMSFAITNLKADKVDVNEQNINAVKFYKKLGFEIYERTDTDDQGRNYPLLRMKLK